MPNQPIKYGEMLAEELERQLKPLVIEPDTITEKDAEPLNVKCGNDACGFRLCLGYEQLVCPYCTEPFKQANLSLSFEEVFEAFDRWYWDKYRHHPPKMEIGVFYEFLKLNGIVK